MAEREKYRIRQVSSLKNNCLQCITDNFDRFNNAFLSLKEPVPHRHLEFLQRKYSSHFIQTLNKKRILNDRHLEFLINEHLKELDLKDLVESCCSFKAVEERIALVGHGFTKVSLELQWDLRKLYASKNYIADCLNASICHFSNVEILRIYRLCNDTTLKNVSLFCKKLKVLDMDGSTDITGKGLIKLCKKYSKYKTNCLLKVLSMRCTHMSESTIGFLLRNMPSLEVLNYDYLPCILHTMHKYALQNKPLNNVKYNLTKLDFSRTYIPSFLQRRDESEKILVNEEIVRVFTEVCPKIRDLCILYATPNCVDLICRFSDLRNLTVRFEIGKPTDFNNFLKSNGRKLESLAVDCCILSIPILIQGCPKLEKLALTGVEFQPLEDDATKEQSSNKRSLNRLIELRVKGTTFTNENSLDSVTNVLLSSPHLENLYFHSCEFGDTKMNAMLAKFCKDRALVHIIFFQCGINLALLESIILTCSSPLTLSVRYCKNISNDDANSLLQLIRTKRSLVDVVFDMLDLDYADDDDVIYYSFNEL